jgi:hypothetical protein
MSWARRVPASASRHLLLLVVALVAATGMLTLPGHAPEVRAAAPSLTIVTDATYEVQPEQHRVQVTLDMVLTNHLRDTRSRRYYFDHAFIGVLPDASDYKLSWSGGGKPGVAVSKKTDKFTVLDLALGERIYSGKTAKYRLTFSLVDGGGTATRDIRVGTALASFPVWAFATDSTPGSTVKVVFPAGFEAEVQAGDIPPAAQDSAGRVVFQTPPLAQPTAFFAYLVGDRPGQYAEQSATAEVGSDPVDVTVRAWPDDKAWSERVSGLVTRALPALSTRIGQPWPRDGGLVIQEAVGRSTGGYAGLFDPKAGEVEIAYFADDPVVLHEAAHSWFNGSLLADRWANEAFASYYGFEAAKDLGVEGKPDTLTPELEAAKIPLNAWRAVGREDTKTEDYAYAASLTLARAIAERAGDDALKAVWADATKHIGAYQPAPGTADGPQPAAETVDQPPDWRGLLDLLDGHTGKSFDDLWQTWVTRPSDAPLLEARRAARTEYAAVIAKAADWQLPRPVRDDMRAWRFDEATALLHDASAVLDSRASIAAAAAKSGLTPPPTLRTAFEAPGGFGAATEDATAEQAAIDRYDAAVASRIASPDVFQTLGLWDATPEASLGQARDAFAAGDLVRSAGAAGAASAAWASAAELGRGRAISIGAGGLAILLALVMLIVLARSWRGRRRRQVLVPAAAGEADANLDWSPVDEAASGLSLSTTSTVAAPAPTVAPGADSPSEADSGSAEPREVPTERVPVADAYGTLAATSAPPETQPRDEAQTGAEPD